MRKKIFSKCRSPESERKIQRAEEPKQPTAIGKKQYLHQCYLEGDVVHFHGRPDELSHIWCIFIQLYQELLLFELNKGE